MTSKAVNIYDKVATHLEIWEKSGEFMKNSQSQGQMKLF